jgi:hypothetical protein
MPFALVSCAVFPLIVTAEFQSYGNNRYTKDRLYLKTIRQSGQYFKHKVLQGFPEFSARDLCNVLALQRQKIFGLRTQENPKNEAFF